MAQWQTRDGTGMGWRRAAQRRCTHAWLTASSVIASKLPFASSNASSLAARGGDDWLGARCSAGARTSTTCDLSVAVACADCAEVGRVVDMEPSTLLLALLVGGRARPTRSPVRPASLCVAALALRIPHVRQCCGLSAS